MQGYGLYWYCLELIASEVDSSKLTFELEHDSEILAHDTGINYQVVQEMMQYMVKLGLFENTNGMITCFALAKRADEYLVKSLKREGKIHQLDEVRSVSGHSPDKVRPEESILKETREKEIKGSDDLDSQAKPCGDDELKPVLQKWNNFAEQKRLATVKGITRSRASRMNAAYKHYRAIRKDLGGDVKTKPEFLMALVDVAENTHRDFHLGVDGGWQMGFDYLLNKATVEHVTEHGRLK